MSDLVKRLRFGSLSMNGASKMNLEAADRIEELEAQLTKVTAERDGLGALLADAYGAILDWDEVLKDRADQEAIAALPRAYRMGLEDAAKHIFTLEHDGTKPESVHQGAWAFTLEQAAGRAPQTPTPTDLVERAMKEAGQ